MASLIEAVLVDRWGQPFRVSSYTASTQWPISVLGSISVFELVARGPPVVPKRSAWRSSWPNVQAQTSAARRGGPKRLSRARMDRHAFVRLA